jgi:hypothetical protein
MELSRRAAWWLLMLAPSSQHADQLPRPPSARVAGHTPGAPFGQRLPAGCRRTARRMSSGRWLRYEGRSTGANCKRVRAEGGARAKGRHEKDLAEWLIDGLYYLGSMQARLQLRRRKDVCVSARPQVTCHASAVVDVCLQAVTRMLFCAWLPGAQTTPYWGAEQGGRHASLAIALTIPPPPNHPLQLPPHRLFARRCTQLPTAHARQP